MKAPLLESSILLRPLNLLRIDHEYSFWQNWLLPTIIFVPIFSSTLLAAIANETDLVSTLSDEASLIQIILPFTITSLAVVSSMQGPPIIDRPFQMAQSVTLVVMQSGSMIKKDVTPRHFICLLLSYITLSCIFSLILYSVFEPIRLIITHVVGYIVSFVFLFLYSQILSHSLLAVYLLGDYLVRHRTP
jgi:hypothetical protein